MTSTAQQVIGNRGGSINFAFDHGEQVSTNHLNTPTDIFCVTQHSSTTSSPSPSTTHDEANLPSIDEGNQQQMKPDKANITIDTTNTGERNLMFTRDGLEVITGVTSQSLCTLSEIDIPSPLSTPKLYNTDNLNTWLQEQESSSTRFDTPVTSFSQDTAVCMQAAGPSGTASVHTEVVKNINKQIEEGDGNNGQNKHLPPKRTDSNMSACSSVQSEGGKTCRICWTGEGKEVLIQPCKCSGSSANVHVSCLKKWLLVTNQFKCEVCRQEYGTAKALKPISKWSWRCSKTRPLSQLEAILILLGIVTPPLLCGIVLCSQKVVEYLPQPQHAWKTATLLTLVIASTLMYVAALIYFCFKLSTVCSQWLQSNQRTVVRLGTVETVIEGSPSVVEARESESHQEIDHDLFTVWTIS